MRLAPVLASLLALSLLVPAVVAVPPLPGPAPPLPAPALGPFAVIAHIDTGINAYHAAFRDASPRAFQHPSTYLPGYPADAQALFLCIDTVVHPLPEECRTFEGARAHDAALWDSVEPRRLYWIPGTRIVAAMRWFSFGGGTSCSLGQAPPASYLPDFTAECKDWPILDDHGHGTMTATRMAGSPHSLCPSCLIVSIEGLTQDGVLWLAEQGWVDVQTNSWVDLVPPPANHLLQPVWDASPELRDNVNLGNSTSVNARKAAEKMAVFFASGNGAAYILGFAPTPTYALSTAPPGVILVGGHDNGFVTAWAGAPPQVVADAYGGWLAVRDSLAEQRPDPLSCCTSASSPYAAGGAAAMLLEARRILQAFGTGLREDAFARAPEGVPLPARGPLADGDLTLAELKATLFHTAQARPREGKDDGLLHWTAEPGGMPPTDLIYAYGPGANPFCQGCWTLPVRWSEVPAELQQFPLVGYGAVNEHSVALARAVLAGRAPEPDRSAEDQLYALDQAVRAAEFTGA